MTSSTQRVALYFLPAHNPQYSFRFYSPWPLYHSLFYQITSKDDTRTERCTIEWSIKFMSNFPTLFPIVTKIKLYSRFYKTKKSRFFSWVRPALRFANTVDVSPIKLRSIRLWKEVVNYLCIACMRLCNQSWVARTIVESFPTWEKAKANLCATHACKVCIQTMIRY